jgi:hypothetical protein
LKIKDTTLNKVKAYRDGNGNLTGYTFYCPGCEITHLLKISSWSMINAHDPTVNPSYNLVGKCHCIITNGKIDYLGDSKHKYASTVVNMIPVCLWPKGKQFELIDGKLQEKQISKAQQTIENIKKSIVLTILKPETKTYKPYNNHYHDGYNYKHNGINPYLDSFYDESPSDIEYYQQRSSPMHNSMSNWRQKLEEMFYDFLP